MATIVNAPAAAHEHVHDEERTDSMISLVIGVLIVLLLAAFFFFVGLPLIRTAAAPVQAPQINVPDKINIDVNPNAGGGNAPAP